MLEFFLNKKAGANGITHPGLKVLRAMMLEQTGAGPNLSSLLYAKQLWLSLLLRQKASRELSNGAYLMEGSPFLSIGTFSTLKRRSLPTPYIL
jgi:hypothetical protein